MEKYICSSCGKAYTLYASSGKFNSCPSCGAKLTPVTGFDKHDLEYANSFTPKERKEIFDSWRKHIKHIPTRKMYNERLKKRRQRAKSGKGQNKALSKV